MAKGNPRSWQGQPANAEAIAAEFRPMPRIGPVEAARRQWLAVLLPILVIVPVVAAVAATRPPTYSAEARLLVGRLNLSEPGAIQGYAQAAQDLAATYPLAIDSDGVIDPLARTFHMSRQSVINSITASEVPSSAIVRVDATAKSAHLAVSLANAASGSLVQYLATQNRDDPDIARLFMKMHAAQLAYQKAEAAVPPLPKPPAHLTAAEQIAVVNAADAKARANAASHNYQATSQIATVSSLLQPIVSANQATSDRKTKLELSTLIAFIAALIIGLTWATVRVNRQIRRELILPAWEPEAQDARPET